jgi:D-glycero-D-manno-heptose 1,7-bisphosphate phosphatase
LGKAVFFDRDGVLIRAIVRDGRPYPPRDDREFAWMDGVHETLAELDKRGYVLLVCTNQPDVARGTQSQEQVEAFHLKIRNELPVARVYACLHDDADECSCRKPKPGMIFHGRDDFGIDLHDSWVVGDRWKDIEAGRAAGCHTVYLRHGYTEPEPMLFDYQIAELRELLSIIQ